MATRKLGTQVQNQKTRERQGSLTNAMASAILREVGVQFHHTRITSFGSSETLRTYIRCCDGEQQAEGYLKHFEVCEYLLKKYKHHTTCMVSLHMAVYRKQIGI